MDGFPAAPGTTPAPLCRGPSSTLTPSYTRTPTNTPTPTIACCAAPSGHMLESCAANPDTGAFPIAVPQRPGDPLPKA